MPVQLPIGREDEFRGVIDLVKHVESLDALVPEVSAFDDSVGVVLDWINASEERKPLDFWSASASGSA